MTPEITVIMSAYNADKFVAKAIESILNQTFTNFEFIIFEDGSADKTYSIIESFAKNDKRIQLIRNENNIGYRGFIRNLAKGKEMAKTKLIARMDADDIALPNRFQIQKDFLDTHPDIFLVGAVAEFIDENDYSIGISDTICDSDKLAKELIYRNQIIHPSIMFRNNELNYRDKAMYGEDYDLYLQAVSKGYKLANICEKLIKYRVFAESVTSSKLFYMGKFRDEIKKFYSEKMRTNSDAYYDSFSIENIMNLTSPRESRQIAKEAVIGTYLSMFNKKLTRKKCTEYFNEYGFLNKVIMYYFVSLLPVSVIRFIKKTLHR